MCDCEREFALRFLPHQVTVGTDLRTKRRIPVTLGFQYSICNTCRNLPEPAAPKSPAAGPTSKIRRYYWREIHKLAVVRFAEWAEKEGTPDLSPFSSAGREAWEEIEESAVEEMKALHRSAPKYQYEAESTARFVAENAIEVVHLSAAYGPTTGPRAVVIDAGRELNVDEFVAAHYRSTGWTVVRLESKPLHALFATFLHQLINDATDPESSLVGFGRPKRDGGEEEEVWMQFPLDFGSAGYGSRRAAEIEREIQLLPRTREELLWLFDYWLEPSANLRRYLHADEDDTRSRARVIVEALPPETIRRILEFLVGSYWERYLGWPDLLVHNERGFCLVEVKSARDKLSPVQMRWIAENKEHMHLPFVIVRVDRAKKS